MDTIFQTRMKTLFRHMGIEMQADRQNDVYAIGVDDQVKMKFFAAPAGYLNAIADIGPLPEAVAPAVLMNLLKLNCFTPVFPNFNFKVGFNETSGNVEVWLRQELDGLKDEELIALFDFLVETAGYVKSWMDKPLTKQRSAQFLSRLASGTDAKK